jgi:hypothetical protein
MHTALLLSLTPLLQGRLLFFLFAFVFSVTFLLPQTRDSESDAHRLLLMINLIITAPPKPKKLSFLRAHGAHELDVKEQRLVDHALVGQHKVERALALFVVCSCLGAL